MLWILLTASGLAAPLRFHPGSGPELVELGDDGRIGGVPATPTGRILVRVADPEALRTVPGVASIRTVRGQVVSITPAPGTDLGELSRALHDRPDVVWAHPDLRLEFKARQIPNDPYFDEQWHLQNTGQHGYHPGSDLNVEAAWELSTGAGQLVAAIDTGSDVDHPDLVVYDGHDYVDGDASSDPGPNDEHGTAVAGLMAAIGGNGIGVTGVAYDAEVYSIRLIGYSTTEDMYEAFVEATDAGAAVLNNSWGFDDGCAYIPAYGAITDAIDYAEDNGRDGKGAQVVFAAGNGNCDITDDGMLAYPPVVGVAAINGWDDKEWYSSFGPWVDISAPSGRIATTDIAGPWGYGDLNGDDDYWDDFNGTSASAPEISGVFALMFAANKRLRASEAREVLCATAVRMDLEDGDWDESGWSPYYGCGRADAGAAVRAVYNLGAPEAPIAVGPVGEVQPDDAVLQWAAPLDPDGDRLTYKVSWWYSDRPEAGDELEVEGTWSAFPDEVALQPGDAITWKVRAFDLWGAGPWSEESSFTVAEPAVVTAESEKGGCDTTPGAPAWAGLVALLAVRRRRA